MSYNIEDNNGASRTIKTIAIYSAIIVFFGALLGGVYFWANRSYSDFGEEEIAQDLRSQDEQDIEALDMMEFDPDLKFETREELQAYIDGHIPPEDSGAATTSAAADEQEEI